MEGESAAVFDGTKDQQVGLRPSISCIEDEEEKSENVKSSNISTDKNNLIVVSD